MTDEDTGPVEPSSKATPPPSIRPVWTYFLMPAAVLIGALAIAGAIAWTWGRDGDGDDAAAAATGDMESHAPGSAATGESLLETFLGYAEEVGLDEDEFQECLGTDEPAVVMNDHLQRGSMLGVNGTPTFFINNKVLVGSQPVELMEEIIDGELSDSPPESIEQYSPGLQQLAASGRFKIAESQPDTSGAEFEGDPEAQVMIAEFSDFQCPFCQRWVTQSLPAIRELLGAEVALAFMHFPIVQIHPNAGNAGAAAICAGQQGKFWEMHDLLFARQQEWEAIP